MKNDDDHHSKIAYNITAHTTIQTRQVQKPKLGQHAWSTRFLLSLLYQNFCVIKEFVSVYDTHGMLKRMFCSYSV